MEYFSFLLIENRFSDDEVIIQDEKALCHRVNSIQAFLQERNISSITWPTKNFNLNLNEKKNVSILQSWSVICCLRRFESFWWRIFFLFSKVNSSKNSDHKIDKRSYKVLIAIYFFIFLFHNFFFNIEWINNFSSVWFEKIYHLFEICFTKPECSALKQKMFSIIFVTCIIAMK